jgi:demethoxyubiquinone hydroxylase (CLK1/Coq7/Cat5 family)
MTHPDKTIEDDVQQLNSFLRGEMSAVETYRQCIDKLDNSAVRTQLVTLQRSHANRAAQLRNKILSLGGVPAENSGAWGSFTKLIEGGAKMFGEKTALAVLEEGEDHGRDDYIRDVNKLTSATSAFVQSWIIPEQQKTHDTLSALTKRL